MVPVVEFPRLLPHNLGHNMPFPLVVVVDDDDHDHDATVVVPPAPLVPAVVVLGGDLSPVHPN